MLPLKQREFDLQHSLPIALHSSSPSNHVRRIVSECLEFKSSTRQNKGVMFLDNLEKILEEWEKRDAVYRKNPALAATSSALRLMKQWATRVVSVADMEADASQENTQKAIETVLLQQRCALSEWLKRENDNKYLPEDIRKKCRAAEDAVQNGDEKQVSATRVIVLFLLHTRHLTPCSAPRYCALPLCKPWRGCAADTPKRQSVLHKVMLRRCSPRVLILTHIRMLFLCSVPVIHHQRLGSARPAHPVPAAVSSRTGAAAA
jgi:hypothetical protein